MQFAQTQQTHFGFLRVGMIAAEFREGMLRERVLVRLLAGGRDPLKERGRDRERRKPGDGIAVNAHDGGRIACPKIQEQRLMQMAVRRLRLLKPDQDAPQRIARGGVCGRRVSRTAR